MEEPVFVLKLYQKGKKKTIVYLTGRNFSMKMSIFAANISEDSRMQLHMYQTEIFLKIIFQKKRLALLESRKSTMVQRM